MTTDSKVANESRTAKLLALYERRLEYDPKKIRLLEEFIQSDIYSLDDRDFQYYSNETGLGIGELFEIKSLSE